MLFTKIWSQELAYNRNSRNGFVLDSVAYKYEVKLNKMTFLLCCGYNFYLNAEEVNNINNFHANFIRFPSLTLFRLQISKKKDRRRYMNTMMHFLMLPSTFLLVEQCRTKKKRRDVNEMYRQKNASIFSIAKLNHKNRKENKHFWQFY